jgi:hypothetical protein
VRNAAHHMVDGVKDGQQGRMAGHPEVTAVPDDGMAGHGDDAPGSGGGAGTPLRVPSGLRLRISGDRGGLGW